MKTRQKKCSCLHFQIFTVTSGHVAFLELLSKATSLHKIALPPGTANEGWQLPVVSQLFLPDKTMTQEFWRETCLLVSKNMKVDLPCKASRTAVPSDERSTPKYLMPTLKYVVYTLLGTRQHRHTALETRIRNAPDRMYKFLFHASSARSLCGKSFDKVATAPFLWAQSQSHLVLLHDYGVIKIFMLFRKREHTIWDTLLIEYDDTHRQSITRPMRGFSFARNSTVCFEGSVSTLQKSLQQCSYAWHAKKRRVWCGETFFIHLQRASRFSFAFQVFLLAALKSGTRQQQWYACTLQKAHKMVLCLRCQEMRSTRKFLFFRLEHASE